MYRIRSVRVDLPGKGVRGNFMDAVHLTEPLIIVLFIGALIVGKMLREKRLEEYLFKYGVEIEAEAKLIKSWMEGFLYIEVSFQINGQQIKKRMTIDNLEWLGSSCESTRKFPVLVDPFNPKRFLFNLRKFHLQKTSDDSTRNFQERYKAENPDRENYDQLSEEK